MANNGRMKKSLGNLDRQQGRIFQNNTQKCERQRKQ